MAEQLSRRQTLRTILPMLALPTLNACTTYQTALESAKNHLGVERSWTNNSTNLQGHTLSNRNLDSQARGIPLGTEVYTFIEATPFSSIVDADTGKSIDRSNMFPLLGLESDEMFDHYQEQAKRVVYGHDLGEVMAFVPAPERNGFLNTKIPIQTRIDKNGNKTAVVKEPKFEAYRITFDGHDELGKVGYGASQLNPNGWLVVNADVRANRRRQALDFVSSTGMVYKGVKAKVPVGEFISTQKVQTAKEPIEGNFIIVD